MPKIYVKTPFKLQHGGETREFGVGNHTVPPAMAEHWYVKAHIGEEPPAGEEGDAALAEQRAALDSAAEFLEGKAKQLKDQQDDLDAREKAIAAREQAAEQREADLVKRETAVAEREQAADKAAADAAKAAKTK